MLPTLFIKGSLNPTNNETKEYLDEFRPIDYIKDWFKSRLGNNGLENRVLVLKSETASGKSTAIPPMLYRTFCENKPPAKGLICTQPRALTAQLNVLDIIRNVPLRVGENIGWSTKHNKMRPRAFGLLSATIQTLTMQLRSWSDTQVINTYRFILIDETHERDLQTDMTIYMLRNFLLRNAHNPQCPFVVLMSATFDPEVFLKYFNLTRDNYIWCSGQSFGRDEEWDWNQGRTVNNFATAAAEVVAKISETPDNIETADILIFMPGKREFTDTAEALSKLNERLASESPERTFSILQIDSQAQANVTIDYKRLFIPTGEQINVFRINGEKVRLKASRRVIIATNVAETGLTLHNLKYVIDAGFNKEIEFNPIYRIRALLSKPAPVSRIIQRMGRAGRKFRGVFYPLYPKYVYERLPKLQYAQILTNDVSDIFLDIAWEQLRGKYAIDANAKFSLRDLGLLENPSDDAIAAAMEKMYQLGFMAPHAPKFANMYSPVDPPLRETIGCTPWQYGNTTTDYVCGAPSYIHDSPNDPTWSITPIGLLVCLLPSMGMKMELVRMILAGFTFGASITDLITIACYVNIGSFVGGDPELELKEPPKIGWTAIYELGMPSGVAIDPATARLLVADEFIDGLILLNAVKRKLSEFIKKDAVGALSNLKEWCYKTNIAFKTLMALIAARDDLIEQLYGDQFAVFANQSHALSQSSGSNFLDNITRIKYCIREGFIANELTLIDKTYYTPQGISVKMPALLNVGGVDNAVILKPPRVYYRELGLKYNNKTNLYVAAVDMISVPIV